MPREVEPALVPRKLLPGQSVELLKEIHLVGRDGKLHADTLRKLNQVNHLTQFLVPALNDIRARHAEPVMVDAGAGNAYLGFVLYELYLRDRPPDLLYSVETRPELVAKASDRAARLRFDRMRFLQTPLATLADAESGDLPERIHLLTALHACDTATDDALALAVRRKADHIAVVPCCQAEVAAELKAHRSTDTGTWPLLWSHPIHAREFGAHLTNVIRTLVLQSCGYQVTVTELVGWEHSLKNELILARKVHREDRSARARLVDLLGATHVRPKLVRMLFPEMLAASAPTVAAVPAGPETS
jgi:hypothetical protein